MTRIVHTADWHLGARLIDCERHDEHRAFLDWFLAALGELKPGDLVFFNTRQFQFSHVGIYLGDSRFIHAPARGGEVEIARLSETYWQKHFDGARRLVGVLPAMMPSVISPALAEAPAFGAMQSVPPMADADTAR